MRISLLLTAVFVAVAISAPQKDLDCLAQMREATSNIRGELLKWDGGVTSSASALHKVQKAYRLLTSDSACKIGPSDTRSRTPEMDSQSLHSSENLLEEINATIDAMISLKAKIAAVSVIDRLPVVGSVVAKVPLARLFMSKLPETGTRVALLLLDSLRKSSSNLGVVFVSQATPETRNQKQKMVVQIDEAFQRGLQALK